MEKIQIVYEINNLCHVATVGKTWLFRRFTQVSFNYRIKDSGLN
jgi:hypothetical protein